MKSCFTPMNLLFTGTVASLCVLMLPLQPAIAHEPVKLVAKRSPQYEIVIADNPSAAAREAVEELNYWIKKITGTPLPVRKVSEWNGKTPYIAVGKSRLTRENGWEEGTLAQEEARVFIEPGKIGLLGNDESPYPSAQWKGTYYAALEFIRKSLGARWIWPGELGEVYTPRSTLEVQTGSWQWKPHLLLNRSLRTGFIRPDKIIRGEVPASTLGLPLSPEKLLAQHEEQARWLNRERMNKPSNLRFGHAFSKWWDLYSKDHPDWFARPPEGVSQRGGGGVKLNLSNPEVIDKIIVDWKAEWEKNPIEHKYLNVAPNDSRGFDTRPETRAWDHPSQQAYSDKEIFNGGEPVLSDRYVHFWNLVARRARQIDPEVRVATYAYRNYRKPPLGDEMLEPNIIIGYVGAEGYYPDEPFIRDEWKEWARRGAMMFWRPNVLHAGHGIPYLYSRQLSDDFRFFTQHALLGTDFDSLVGHWGTQGLTYYVLAEQHSRPDAPYETLAQEYFDAFGPAAKAIQEYHEYFEERTKLGPELLRKHELVPTSTWGGWWKGHIRLVPLFLTPEVAEKGAALLAKAKEATKGADPVYQARVAMIERAFNHARLMAETFRKLNLQEPLAKLPENAREILEPLYRHRIGLIGDRSVDVIRLFNEEQRQLGIWNAFVQEGKATREERFPIVKGWKFRADPNNQGIKGAWQNSGPTSDWRDIEVGKPWRAALGDRENKTKVVWYRVKFEVPEIKDTGERLELLFGSVDSETKIWINGVLVNERGYPHNGNYESWAEPFAVDISKTAKPGPNNEMVVRVESENRNAGITGPVTLVLKE